MIKITLDNMESIEIVINNTKDYCRNTLVEKSLIYNQGITEEDYLDIINKLLSNVPTIEMKQVYETENIQQIRSTWFREIARALESTIEVVCVRESILNGIKEKV